jgi:N-acetylneuraminate synthase
MNNSITIGGRTVGEGWPIYIAAEIGINHNGDIDLALRLIDAAAQAGCDAVKFQKRTPTECVPAAQQNRLRETPWGIMSYLDYRHRLEFGREEFEAIDAHCRAKGLQWFASAWDVKSVDFLMMFNPPCLKIPSALATNLDLLDHANQMAIPVILSTGMSTIEQIRTAVARFTRAPLMLLQSTSAYPCPSAQINLRAMQTLRSEFGVPVGYSGHEVGLQISLAAAALGACMIERHLTLDRAMWGSDQAASVEPSGFARLVRDIRVIEAALGDGVKRVYDIEGDAIRRLRGS